MSYKLVVTERAEELLDGLVMYLAVRLNNKPVAQHLLNGIDSIYMRLEENPFQFPVSRDPYLANKGYHVAIVAEMNYIVVFNINEDTINVVGFFHQLENYNIKV